MKKVEDFPVYREFMTVNVCSKRFREKRKLLLYGECVRDEYPEIYQRYAAGRVSLAICMEKEHMNMVGFKLAGLLARIDLEEIVVLTVDGSPHCIQLHFTIEEVEKILGKNLNRKHYVIENGRAVSISKKTVKKARYLSYIENVLKKARGDNV